MTQRLYYDDSYKQTFSARVVKRVVVENRQALIFDRTYFYPESGGQPSDAGTVNGVAVVALLSEDADVLHVLAEDMPADEVICQVDWARRFDYMQHHTGQHILTQAFVQTAGAQTVAFHLSADTVTIDLDKLNLPQTVVDAAEDLANQIVYDNRVVRARVLKPEEIEQVRIRKIPEKLYTDGLRVIDIEGFDITACGGTHVARTGEIGMIKLIKLEKRGDKTRVEFRCGLRALQDYRLKNAVISQTAADLSCRFDEIDQAVSRLRDDFKQMANKAKALSTALVSYETEHLQAAAVLHYGVRVVMAAFEDRDPAEVRLLASRLTQQADTVALLGTSGAKAQVVLARSENMPLDMNLVLKQALALLGDARGGGQPGLVQGGGIPASLDQVRAALAEAERMVKAALGG